MVVTIRVKRDSGLKDCICRNFSSSLYGYFRQSKAKFYINKEEVKHTANVKRGDVVQVKYQPIVQLGYRNPGRLIVVYEDPECLVVNKPAGLPTTPSKAHPRDSVYNRLLYRFKDTNYTVHFISRLDLETSGLLLVAKTQVAACLFNRKDFHLHKRYFVDTYQPLDGFEGKIEGPIGKIGEIKRGIIPDGHPSVTHYLFWGVYNGYYRYLINIPTGRCHQIRVHLASKNAAVVNDKLYAPSELVDTDKPMHLHAYAIEFRSPFSDYRVRRIVRLPW